MEKLGRRIRRLRQALDLTAAELARRSGVGKSSLSEIEADTRESTNPHWLARIATELGVTLDELVNGTGRAAPPSPPVADPPAEGAEGVHIRHVIRPDLAERLRQIAREMQDIQAEIDALSGPDKEGNAG